MPSTYSTRLRFELIATGEQSGTWGTTTNTNLGTLLEEAIAGVSSVTHDDSASYSLTTSSGGTDEARHMVLEVGGTLTANRNVVCPTQEKMYLVKNGTSGGFSITIKTSGGSGITIPNGKTRVVYCDGTNVVSGIDDLPASSTVNNVEIVTLTGSQTLTNKTLTTPVISSISNSGTLTLPTGAETLVGRATTDTLTNKTIAFASNTLTGVAPLASPALTGTPTAPTAGAGTNTTQIATTAFVNAEIANDYTAADVLAKLLTVDGDGSLLDADKVGATDNDHVMLSKQAAGDRLHIAYSDWDDATDIGMWNVVDWGTNIPTNGPTGAYGFGTLMVIGSNPASGGVYLSQLYFPASNEPDTGGMWLRHASTGAYTFGDWQHVMLDNSSRTNETLTSSTSISIGWTGTSKKSLTLDHNTTITIGSDDEPNQEIEVWITQGSTGGTASWSGVNKWIGGSAPTLSTTAGQIDIIRFSVTDVGGLVIGNHLGVAS